MNCPRDRLYSDYHLWALPGESALVVIGLTRHGLDEMGEPDYVELPEPGALLIRDKVFGVMETVKAAVELPAPITGVVTKRNPALEANPGVISESPYDEGWLLEAQIQGPDELEGLMTAERYESLVLESRPPSRR